MPQVEEAAADPNAPEQYKGRFEDWQIEQGKEKQVQAADKYIADFKKYGAEGESATLKRDLDRIGAGDLFDPMKEAIQAGDKEKVLQLSRQARDIAREAVDRRYSPGNLF